VGLRQLNAGLRLLRIKEAQARGYTRPDLRISMICVIERPGIHALYGKARIRAEVSYLLLIKSKRPWGTILTLSNASDLAFCSRCFALNF